MLSSSFNRHVKEAKLPPITLHGLRDTSPRVGLDAGVDVLYMAKVLGHSSPAITQSIYQLARDEPKPEAISRIGTAIFD